MKRVHIAITIGATLCAISAAAQTTVTTSGGTTNTIPLFTGSSAVGNSAIAQSGGNVGIGTSSPGAKLDIEGGNLTVGSGNISVPGGGDGTNPPIHFNSYAPAGFNPGGSIGIWLSNNAQLSTNVSMSTTGSVTTGGPGFGLYFRTPPTGQNNTVVAPALLLEGLLSGNGTAATPYGLNIMSVPWSWSQDPITYHGGIHVFRTTNGNTVESETMRIAPTGVGIGTTAPGAKLEVNGNIKLTAGSGASITFADGSVQSTAYTGVTCGGDYAESVDIVGNRKNYEPGDVLVLNPEKSSDTVGSDIAKSSEPYSTLVAGIYSTKPGVVGRRQTTYPKTSTTEVPMAMVGIVPTKVSAENGPIQRGDLLVTSSTPGYAMKGTDRSRMLGAVVGKAMGTLDSGTGVIEVLVTLQ